MLIAVACACGCAHRNPPASASNASASPDIIHLGDSVAGAPITVKLFKPAHGPFRDSVLIIGGIHGNEPTSVDVARALAGALTADPRLLAGRTVGVIEVANPDGYAKRTRTNANGVDVNRNFPARNFRRRPRRDIYFGGDEPASEPETRAILAALDRLRPALVISIHSIADGRECNNFDGPAETVAQAMSRHNGYPVTRTMGYPTPGSFGSYAGIDNGIAVVTLELPRKVLGQAAWQRNRDALLAAIGHAAPGRQRSE